jgi:hypothetical protein
MPTALFTKLNLGTHTVITVLDAPDSFAAELAELAGVTVRTTLRGSAPIAFAIAFAQRQAQVDALATRLVPRLADDAVFWIAYPKGTSTRFRCEFNRDTGWTAIGTAGFEPVRQVAIDEDWSALRFRRTTHIKALTRRESMLRSPEGKARRRG